MKNARFIFILWVLTISLLFSTSAWSVSEEQNYYDVLTRKVIDKVKKLEIINYPASILARTALNKEMLMKNHQFKLIFTNLTSSLKFKSLCKVLKEEKISKQNDNIVDLRWGCIFYDEQGVPMLSIYLTGDGGKGYIQEHQVVFCTKKIFSWLKTNFGTCFQ